jgi:predicted DNA repair protein MutK
MDDAGLYLTRRPGAGGMVRGIGRFLLAAAPKLMKFLSVAGTVAMFTVGGSILLHGIPGAHDVIHHAVDAVDDAAAIGPALAAVTPPALEAVGGVIAGAIVLAVVTMIGKAATLFRHKA